MAYYGRRRRYDPERDERVVRERREQQAWEQKRDLYIAWRDHLTAGLRRVRDDIEQHKLGLRFDGGETIAVLAASPGAREPVAAIFMRYPWGYFERGGMGGTAWVAPTHASRSRR